ncbi:MAG: hypothetical protein NT062_16580 [Proteobacteria bacterium]|nr:hypothetical protein [Pseudomonadota bacterium]
MRFKPDELTRLRRGIMKRGQTLSTVLADLLAGKQHPSMASILAAKPGLRPEEAVRKMLDEVEARRKLIDADDDAYGRCDVCGEDLGIYALGELPWADRCHAHASV